MQNIIYKLRVLFFTLCLLFIFYWSTSAASANPPSCNSNWISISMVAYDSDWTTINDWDAEPWQLIKYKTILSYNSSTAWWTKNCYFSSWALSITTPDWILHNVTPIWDIPLITNVNFFISNSVDYTVDSADVIWWIFTATTSYTWWYSYTKNWNSAWWNSSISTNYLPISLDVSKTVNTSYTETYSWDINKSVVPNNFELFDGQTGTWNYSVTVTKSLPINSDYLVNGSITIYNPALYASANITNLSDVLDIWNWLVSVICDWDALNDILPYTLSPWDTLNCDYLAYPTNSWSTLNTVIVTTDSDILWWYWTWVVDWWNAEITTINWAINIGDSLEWHLGTTNSTHTYNYSKIFDCKWANYVNNHWQEILSNTATILETDQSDYADVTIDCYKPTISKTALLSSTVWYTWSIDKDVSPATWDLFMWDTWTSVYNVSVVKSNPDYNYKVSGEIVVTNTSTSLILPVDNIEDEVSWFWNIDIDCWDFPQVINPWESLSCNYVSDLPDDDSRINTATAIFEAWINSVSWTANIDFSNINPVVIWWEIDVSDTNWMNWHFTDTDTKSYSNTFVCWGSNWYKWLNNVINNTVIIDWTDISDSASVIVNCYDLDVSKTAETTFDRTYLWDIKKTWSVDNLTLADWETYTVDYTVWVTQSGYIDSNWWVNWQIFIKNNNPFRSAELVDIVDILSNSDEFNVVCPSQTIATWDTLVCTYSWWLSSSDELTNNVVVTQQNFEYWDDYIWPLWSTNYSARANVVFWDPTLEFDSSVNVVDLLYGDLWVVNKSDTPKTFNYSYDVKYEWDWSCWEHQLLNTATYTTSDLSKSGSTNWLVNVNVECNNGCTLIQWYWKTHSEFWPAPYDDTWWLLDNWASTLLNWKMWYNIFKTPPKWGNVWYQLAHQWMAAYLNSLNWANTNVLWNSLNDAKVWLETHSPDQKIKWKDDTQAKNWASMFARYNEWSIWPWHCDENLVPVQ